MCSQEIVIRRATTKDDVERCATILRSLPDWFGIEEATTAYIDDIQNMETLVACSGDCVVGFATLNRHNDVTVEIHVMAVDPSMHRQGVGRQLVAEVERTARMEHRRLIEVKTLGPSHQDDHYARTRRFYTGTGFLPIEEIHGLWPGNPCLIMVKVVSA